MADDELIDRIAALVFDSFYDSDIGEFQKRLIFGNPRITFEQIKAMIDSNTVVAGALAAEYRVARAIAVMLPTLKPRLH
jgi:hypothetical protein